ncbi:hypothetical protein [Formosa sp. S-31]|uniref:hypothetical protein n=1 Tax=Formosa sp. S-31 TaxID=2790949 RepID=UPI003EB852B5
MKQLSIQSLFSALLISCIALGVQAQQKLTKASQSLKVDKNVTIKLKSDYTTIKVDTWNKDIIEVEAFIESDKLSKEELQQALEQWRVDVSGSDDYVTITSSGMSGNMGNLEFYDLASLEALKDLESELAPIPPLPPIPNLGMLPMPNIPEMPQMPALPELPEGISSFDFDYDTYKKEGEAYLDKWSKTYQDKYGKEYQEKMKKWAKEFEKSGFGDYEKEMEAWGEKFGKEYGEKMEAWGKQFGESFGKDFEKNMEAWGKSFEKQMEAREKQMELRESQRVARESQRDAQIAAREHSRIAREHANENRKSVIIRKTNRGELNPSVKKTLIIHMPKKANLKVDVKYGELQFVSAVENLNAEMSHTKLTANTIDGSKTSINVSYAPVEISNWNQGNLVLNFVDQAQLQSCKRMVLNSNSSNIDVVNLTENAIINGSFGDLKIKNITDTFQNLSIVLENSTAVISLPESDYNLQYQGKQSKFMHPKKTATDQVANFSIGDAFSNKSIIVNAKYSKVLME